MKHNKRLLSLLLAGLLCLSLTVPASAADFTDQDEVEHAEAVDIMRALGITVGDGGEYQPNGLLNRADGASMIAKLLLGSDADSLHTTGNVFGDVSAGQWSAGHIEYCAGLGIIGGNGGNFEPAGQLTVAAYAKMLLAALGYDSRTEGLLGGSWDVNTVALAQRTGLYEGLKDGIPAGNVTREKAAQMTLNALRSSTVTYADGKAARTDTMLRDKYLPDLELTEGTDPFGRPIRTWSYKEDEIGTYVEDEALAGTYAEAVDMDTLFALLGKDVAEGYQLEYLVDGEPTEYPPLTQGSKQLLPGSGNGVVTEVFVDEENKTITVTSVTPYMAEAKDDYDAARDEITLLLHGVRETEDGKLVRDPDSTATVTLKGEDHPFIEDLVKGDKLTFTMAKGEIRSMAQPETVSGSVTNVTDKGITVDGVNYEFSAGMSGIPNFDPLKQYDLILDANGYVLGIQESEPPATRVVLKIDRVDGVYSFSADTVDVVVDPLLTSWSAAWNEAQEMKASDGISTEAGRQRYEELLGQLDDLEGQIITKYGEAYLTDIQENPGLIQSTLVQVPVFRPTAAAAEDRRVKAQARYRADLEQIYQAAGITPDFPLSKATWTFDIKGPTLLAPGADRP